jgi:hypothetical protein
MEFICHDFNNRPTNFDDLTPNERYAEIKSLYRFTESEKKTAAQEREVVLFQERMCKRTP